MNPQPEDGIVIIGGGGLAAVRTVQRMRGLGCTDPIALFSEESVLPYARPPLSKDFLTGSLDDGRFVAELRTSGQLTGVFGSNSPHDFLKSRLTFGKAAKC